MSCSRFEDVDLAAYIADPNADEWATFREHYPTCADCSAEVASHSLVEEVVRNQIPKRPSREASPHPDEDLLIAYHDATETLDEAQRLRLERHLEGCFECRTALKMLGSFDFAAVARSSDEIASLDAERARRASPGTHGERRSHSAKGARFSARRGFALAAGLALALIGWRLISGLGSEEPGAHTPRSTSSTSQQLAARVEEDPVVTPSKLTGEETPGLARKEAPLPKDSGSTPAESRSFEPASHETDVLLSDAQESLPDNGEPSEKLDGPARQQSMFAALSKPFYRHPDPLEGIVRTPTLRTAGQRPPRVVVLAPEHVALTTVASPSLYWFSVAAAPLRVRLTIEDARSIDPLLDIDLAPRVEAGIHAVPLVDHGVTLTPGVTYRWTVTLLEDEDLRSVVSRTTGAIRRVERSRSLEAALAASDEANAGRSYADHGIWYDGLDFYSKWIEDHPDDTAAREHRAALLDQVGLDEAATYLR